MTGPRYIIEFINFEMACKSESECLFLLLKLEESKIVSPLMRKELLDFLLMLSYYLATSSLKHHEPFQ